MFSTLKFSSTLHQLLQFDIQRAVSSTIRSRHSFPHYIYFIHQPFTGIFLMSYDDRDGCRGGEDGNGNGNSAIDVVVAYIEPACLKTQTLPSQGPILLESQTLLSSTPFSMIAAQCHIVHSSKRAMLQASRACRLDWPASVRSIDPCSGAPLYRHPWGGVLAEMVRMIRRSGLFAPPQYHVIRV